MANEPIPEMEILVEETENNIDNLTGALENGDLEIDQWETEMQNLLVRVHLVSYMFGQRNPDLDVDDLFSVAEITQSELLYLRNFTVTMQSAREFESGWFARARMYASAVNQTYWTGNTKFLPLPAMPGQGTICHSNCRCEWDVVTVDRLEGDFDAYWRLDRFVAEDDHCQTCLQRSEDWNPVQIRNGELRV